MWQDQTLTVTCHKSAVDFSDGFMKWHEIKPDIYLAYDTILSLCDISMFISFYFHSPYSSNWLYSHINYMTLANWHNNIKTGTIDEEVNFIHVSPDIRSHKINHEYDLMVIMKNITLRLSLWHTLYCFISNFLLFLLSQLWIRSQYICYNIDWINLINICSCLSILPF